MRASVSVSDRAIKRSGDRASDRAIERSGDRAFGRSSSSSLSSARASKVGVGVERDSAAASELHNNHTETMG